MNRVLFILVSGLLFACQRKMPLCRAPNRQETAMLQTGDVVFCAGQSVKSDIVRTTSSGNTIYSHVGFIVRRSSEVLMVHMSADTDTIRCETFKEYIGSSKATALAFYRIPALTDTVRLQQFLDSLIAVKMPFDRNFDFDDPMRLYCTELVVKTVKAAGCEVFSTVDTCGYVYPDDLMRVHGMKPLFTISNNPNNNDLAYE